MRRRIATFRIGPQGIPVFEIKDLRLDEGVTLGLWDGVEYTISLRAGMADDQFWTVLLHELAHAAHAIIAGGSQQCETLDYADLDERLANAVALAVAQNLRELARLAKTRSLPGR